MGLIASLNRAEEALTPSCPLGLIPTDCALATSTPRTPATKVIVCVPAVPMRIVLDSPAAPALPISRLLLPVVRFTPADWPRAMLEPPVVLLSNALAPSAVLFIPVVLFWRAE